MARGHVSLLPSVQDAAELYELLDALQTRLQVCIGNRVLLMLGLLAGGFVLPGSMGMASWCLAAVAGLATTAAIGDYIARRLLMDVVTLHEVIRPSSDAADVLAYHLAQLIATDAPNEAEPGSEPTSPTAEP